ncbi:MAG: type IV pilus assembly protein PilM [Candidatus Daviesbacteria bacterium]|nr:type IV pilus assembly protein PilM [Candidatus Daviesbacteria bacterium]
MAANIVTGLDLGAHSIKCVVLSHTGKLPKLVSLGSVASPQPGLASDGDIDLEAVGTSVEQLLTSLKAPTDAVVISLPESKIFTRVVTDLPFLTDEELASAIKYSAEEFVPLPVDQVNLYWQVIDRQKQTNKTQVFVVASPKIVVNKYLKALGKIQLKPWAMETDLVAAARALVGSNELVPTTMVIQMGASSTDFAVISKGVILITRSIATGGIALTRAIAQYLNFEILQAEEYKKVYGLIEDQLEGKIYQAIKPLVDVLISESSRVIQAFQAKNSDNPIKRVVLAGSGAKLPGLVGYFANSIGLEVQEADPWDGIEKDPSLVTKLASEAPSYTVAVGLALRNE